MYDQNVIFTDPKESSLSLNKLIIEYNNSFTGKNFPKEVLWSLFFILFFFEWEMFSRFIGLRSFTIFSIKFSIFHCKKRSAFYSMIWFRLNGCFIFCYWHFQQSCFGERRFQKWILIYKTLWTLQIIYFEEVWPETVPEIVWGVFVVLYLPR